MTNYLGIKIDYGRDALLSPFAMATLKDRYLYEGQLDFNREGSDGTVCERSPQEGFARASVYAATFLGHTDYALAQRLYDAASLGWFGYATPILSNGGTTRGLPISCFLQFVPDSMDGISNHWRESAALASKGGGLGAYHGSIRTSGVATSRGSRSNGMIPFLKVSDSMMAAVSQGTTRRGAYASYLPVDHPEIKYFLNMRKNDGGDIDRKCLNLHHGVVLSDKFMKIIEKCRINPSYDDSWDLIDPHTKQVIETVSARELWESILSLRAGAGKGEPYIMFGDTVLKNMVPEQYEAGLRVVQSNLCTEITLPTNEDRTAVCCLSSLNLDKYDEWKDEGLVEDLVVALDNIIQHYIDFAAPGLQGETAPLTFNEFSKHVLKKHKAYAKSAYSAYMERSIGVGVMGYHTALQRKMIPFESPMAMGWNIKVHEDIRNQAELASAWLGSVRGGCPDVGTRRNAHLMAIAPTATNSIICGGVSPGIEPIVANVYTHKTDTGNFTVVNPALIPHLQEAAEWAYERGENVTLDDLVATIRDAEGSVQGLEWLSPEVREVFKTAYELDQQHLIDQAGKRQESIDQGQSLNLFFNPGAWADKKAFTRYFEAVHFRAWKQGVKTLYYCRTKAARRAQTTAPVAFEIKAGDCVSCEG